MGEIITQPDSTLQVKIADPNNPNIWVFDETVPDTWDGWHTMQLLLTEFLYSDTHRYNQSILNSVNTWNNILAGYIESVMDSASNIYNEIVQEISPEVQDISTKVDNIQNRINDIPINTIFDIDYNVDEILRKLEDTANQANIDYDTIREIVSEIVYGYTNITNFRMDFNRDFLMDRIEDNYRRINYAYAELSNQIENQTTDILDSVANNSNNVANILSNAIINQTQKMGELADTKVNEIKEEIINLAAGIGQSPDTVSQTLIQIWESWLDYENSKATVTIEEMIPYIIRNIKAEQEAIKLVASEWSEK